MTAPTAPWWKGAVLYQIYPRSFRDANGDGIGDLAGIAEKLDYVASLGVEGVWISPFFPSPMADFGYDVADYCGVDPMFGTLADADRLIARAHALGLKVVIDMVLSHSSAQHPWFQESRRDRTNPKADWYVWAEPRPDGTPPNNWLSVFGGSAWQWEPRRSQYFLHNFLPSQPDLNLHNPVVQDAVLDACRFWLERGVDGFRLDVANYYTHDPMLRDNPARGPDDPLPDGVPANNPYSRQRHIHDKTRPETLPLLRRLRALMDSYPDRFTVAEVHDDDSVSTCARYVAGTDLLHTAYGFGLLGDEFGAAAIRRHVETFERAAAATGAPGWPAWAFSNHDVTRVATRWGGPDASPALAKLLLTLLVCLRGTAFIYQGEELGLPQAEVPFDRLQDPYGKAFWPEFKGRDGCRTPMPWTSEVPNGGFCASGVAPWLPVPADHLARSVALQDRQPDSLVAHTRTLLAWRQAWPVLRTGDIRFLDTPEPVLAFVRKEGDVGLLCIFNLSEHHIQYDCGTKFRVRDGPGSESSDGQHAASRAPLSACTLGPYACIFGLVDVDDLPEG